MPLDNKINVAVIGATGYTGLDLIKILSKHPKVRILHLCAKKNIGKIIEVLYETKNLSYTNNFYKVTIDSKNKKVEKMNGQIIKVKLKSFTNGKFFAEA